MNDASAALGAAGSDGARAKQVHHDIKSGETSVKQPIRDTPPRRDAVGILAEWRAAERALAAAAIDSQEERTAQADVERLREEYRRITAPTPPNTTASAGQARPIPFGS